jgi:hypothetical protein
MTNDRPRDAESTYFAPEEEDAEMGGEQET